MLLRCRCREAKKLSRAQLCNTVYYTTIYITCNIYFKYLGGKGGQVEAVGILGRQGFLKRFNLCLQILYKNVTQRHKKISSLRPMFGL